MCVNAKGTDMCQGKDYMPPKSQPCSNPPKEYMNRCIRYQLLNDLLLFYPASSVILSFCIELFTEIQILIILTDQI